MTPWDTTLWKRLVSDLFLNKIIFLRTYEKVFFVKIHVDIGVVHYYITTLRRLSIPTYQRNLTPYLGSLIISNAFPIAAPNGRVSFDLSTALRFLVLMVFVNVFLSIYCYFHFFGRFFLYFLLMFPRFMFLHFLISCFLCMFCLSLFFIFITLFSFS